MHIVWHTSFINILNGLFAVSLLAIDTGSRWAKAKERPSTEPLAARAPVEGAHRWHSS